MELINRLKPYPLESLSSLLERLRRANYYQEPYWYTALLMTGPIIPDLLRLTSHYKMLSKVTGLSMGNILDLTIFRFQPILDSRSYRRNSLHSEGWVEQKWTNVRKFAHPATWSQTKICPCCWRERKAYLIPWALRIVTTCYFHEVLLVDHCTRCDKPLIIDIAYDKCQNCRLELSELSEISIHDNEASVQITRYIWSALYCSSERFPPKILSIPDDHPLSHSINGTKFIEFLWEFGEFLLKYAYSHSIFNQNICNGSEITKVPRKINTASVVNTHNFLLIMWKILLHWPDSWLDILGYIADCNLIDKKYWAVPYILRTKFPDYYGWSWLTAAWEKFMNEAMFTNTNVIPWIRHYKKVREDPYYSDLYTQLFSQQKAARELGVSQEKIKKFIQDDLLRVTVRAEHLSKRPWQLIEATSLEQLRAEREQHLTLAKAATCIGTSEERVVALGQGKLLNALNGPLIDQTSQWRFEPSALQLCMSNLLGHLPIVPAPTKPKQEIRYFTFIQRSVTWHGKRFVNLMNDIQAGILTMYRAYDQLNLTVLWCYESDLSQYKSLLAQANGTFLSINGVCQRLHCKPLTLRHFHEAGLLIPVTIKTKPGPEVWQYTEEDIEAFQDQYVTTKQAADILNVTKLTIQNWARIGRLKPVAGPEINGSHEYRFEKYMILRWRDDYLSFGETMRLLGISKATLHRWVAEGKVQPLADVGGKQRWFSREEVLALIDKRSSSDKL